MSWSTSCAKSTSHRLVVASCLSDGRQHGTAIVFSLARKSDPRAQTRRGRKANLAAYAQRGAMIRSPFTPPPQHLVREPREGRLLFKFVSSFNAFPPATYGPPLLLTGFVRATQNLHRHPVLFGSALGVLLFGSHFWGGRKPDLGPVAASIAFFFVAATAPTKHKT